MSQEINCPVIGDLLPLYAEGLACAETVRLVEAHLATCPDCRAKYQRVIAAPPTGAEAEHLQSIKPLKRFRFHVLMNILGFPLWLPLLLTGLAVALVLYICIWIVLACLWLIPLCAALCLPGGIFSAVCTLVQGSPGNAVFLLGCALAGAGLAVLSYFPCLWLSKQVIRFTRYLWRRLCAPFTRRKGGSRV